MALDNPAFWLGAVVTTVGTAFGVFLAFALERAAERQRHDAAAFWLARHWGHAMAVMYEKGLAGTALRAIAFGRTAPRRPAVQMALAEIDPRVATWWSKATECLMEAEDSLLPGSATSKRARAWVEQIDREFERATGPWPGRSRRLNRLLGSLQGPPKLTHAAARSAR
jgi:hypothetical protein